MREGEGREERVNRGKIGKESEVDTNIFLQLISLVFTEPQRLQKK